MIEMKSYKIQCGIQKFLVKFKYPIKGPAYT
jgi:hypothetical protein